jgi:hypothetical protein
MGNLTRSQSGFFTKEAVTEEEGTTGNSVMPQNYRILLSFTE